MGFSEVLDYRRFAPHVDVISCNCYPAYRDRPGATESTASRIGIVILVTDERSGKKVAVVGILRRKMRDDLRTVYSLPDECVDGSLPGAQG